MKKVWKYITISLLLLLGLCCVGVLYLFFVPNSSLFNITYINHNISRESEKFNASNVSRIELNSRAYEVNILETEEDEIYVKTRGNSFGFVLKKNSNVNITSKLESNILKFTVTEPYGFAARNDSYINLYIPKNKSVDLHLQNKKAETIINSNVTINNLKYTTQKGNFELKKGIINGNLTLNLEKSNFKIYEEAQTNFNNVTLNLTTGSFKAIKSSLGNVTILSNSRGVIDLNSCQTIMENVPSAGGQIYANTVEHINVTAGDTIVSINEITNSASINLTKSGSVVINTLTGISNIATNSGNIKLRTTNSQLTVQSESGNITINTAYKTVAVKVGYGSANINFADDAESYLINKFSRVLYASIKNGNLTASGVEHVGTPEEDTQTTIDGGVKITGNGKVSLYMNNVYGNNNIVGHNGNIYVVVEKSSIYKLKTSSTAGNVRVNLTQTPEYNGYTSRDLRITYVNCSNSTHNLDISTNYGDLTVLDSNFG